MVGVSAADAHGEELWAEESAAVRRETAAAAVAAAPAAVRLQVNEAMEEEEEEEEEDEAVERAQNEHDARAEEVEDVPANRNSQRMVNVDHLLATCIEPTAAANNILQRLMDRAADDSENIIEYAEHPCVKRRQQILDFLARPVEPEEMRYTRRSAGGLVTEHFFNQGNPRDRQINDLIRRGLEGFAKYPRALKQDIMRIMYVRRAQEIRWFFNACKDKNSILLDTENLPELFNRLGQSFSGPPEE
ncbi:uncharacterized protein LOC116417981 [Nasonia vitripennis]|uniref:Uncharacterized protein n=1 Tax=Nasonia vitripennis TaxID=7425 RepID=A0A7M7QPT9_NASVI|nr:uncharacterized protein LOC116417981 [Nasonia vitripennis]